MARQFTRASSQRLDCGSNAIHNVSNITVAGWGYADSFATSFGYNYFISREETNSPYQGFTLRQYNGSTNFVIAVGGVEYTANGGAVPSTGAWHHWAGTYDGETVLIYIDGVNTGNNTSPSGNMRTPAAGTKTYIGDSYAWTPRFWDGKIEHVAIWNRALSATEIAGLARGYSPQRFRAGGVSYWMLTGCMTPELDLWGGQHGTLSNNPADAPDGYVADQAWPHFETLNRLSPREGAPLLPLERKWRRKLGMAPAATKAPPLIQPAMAAILAM